MAVRRALGRAWGNALGGYKSQNRSKGGQFSSGFSGSVGSASITRMSPGQRRAQYLQKKKKEQRKKTVVKVAGVAGAVALGGAVAYKNRESIGNALGSRDLVMGRNVNIRRQKFTADVRGGLSVAKDSAKREIKSNLNEVTGKPIAAMATAGAVISRAKKKKEGESRPQVQSERYLGLNLGADHAELSRKTYRANYRNETLGGIADPKPTPQYVPGKIDLNPNSSLAGSTTRKGGRQSPVNPETKDPRTLRGEKLDDNSNFHGGDLAESEEFSNMFDDSKHRYVKPDALGTSKNIKSGQRTYRSPAGRAALTGAARQGVRNRKIHETKYIEGLSDPRYKGGVQDTDLSGVLPQGYLPSYQPILTNPDRSRPVKSGPVGQAGANGPLAKTQDWFSAEKVDEFEQLSSTVPMINRKVGALPQTHAKKVTTVRGRKKTAYSKYPTDRTRKPAYQEFAKPWEDILAAEGLAPISLGSYRSTNEIAGTHGGMGSQVDVVNFGGAYEDDEWKFKGRRARR